MTESGALLPSRWHMGIHPEATGMRIRAIGRVSLQLGEALRIEMADTRPVADVNLQYFIATDAGPWALWLSCGPEDADAAEAALRELAPPFADEMSG